MKKRPTILITFRGSSIPSGPNKSHETIMKSNLKNYYNFKPLILPYKRFGIFNLKMLLYIYNKIKKIKPDIVHFGGLQLEGFYILIACKLAGVKKTVLAIHGSSIESTELNGFKRYLLFLIEKFTLKNSFIFYGISKYICNWDEVKKYSYKCFGIIYNVPDDNFNKNSIDIRSVFGWEKDVIIIVSHSRITKEKGYNTLLNVILNMSIPENLKFVIIGTGEFLQEFQNKIEEFKLNNSVKFLGYRNDINNILKQCNIFILCTKHETLSISLLEAGYNGLPSIVSKVGGIPEIVIDGFNGFLVDPNDVKGFINSINILVKDEFKRKEMGINAKQIIEANFNKEKILNRIFELYKEVLKRE